MDTSSPTGTAILTINISHYAKVLPLWVPGNAGELSVGLDWGREGGWGGGDKCGGVMQHLPHALTATL